MKIGDDIVNVTPDCSGGYTAGGHDFPTLDSVSPTQINESPSWGNLSTITLHVSNLWPPYIYDHEGGIDVDYWYRCHLHMGGGDVDSSVTDWTPESITMYLTLSMILGGC